MRIPKHKKFFAVHGKEAENLSELRLLMVEMSDEDFLHHMNGRNDFSQWTRDILHRDELAERMEKLPSRDYMLELIDDEILKDKERAVLGSDEFKRFIVREFVYGLIFGIIIGIIITKLII
ncbi:hypothetical protein H8D36_06950 [archaeon]|nr:hypothetical protein [archaeon]